MRKDEEEILKKRFSTAIIGAIAAFEDNFGYIWGIDKEPEELTENQQKFRDKWELTRNQVLNNGNHQMRKCIQAIDDLNNNNKNNGKFHYKFKKGEGR